MSNPTDGNDSAGKDLSEEELDTVAGGAFDAFIDKGSSLGHPVSGTGLTQVGISEACLNPQPLPP